MTGVSVFKDLEASNREIVDLSQSEVEVLEEIQTAVAGLAAARGIAADIRVTPIGGSIGTVSTVSTVTTVTTVTTVSTVSTVAAVTNLAQIGGVPAQQVVPAAQNMLVANTFGQNIDRGSGGARYA